MISRDDLDDSASLESKSFSKSPYLPIKTFEINYFVNLFDEISFRIARLDSAQRQKLGERHLDG